MSWKWIAETTKRAFGSMKTSVRINYWLNGILFIDMTLVMFSGFMISCDFLPAPGISLPESFVWRSLHDMTTNLSLALLGIHLALHWSWIVNTTKHYIIQPLSSLRAAESKKEVQA